MNRSTWQSELSGACRDQRALRANLGLAPTADVDELGFPLLVPTGFVQRMRRGDPADPLLRQVMPVVAESADAGYSDDPLEEQALAGADGVLQKYRGRALLMPTAACAVHCRYCFRRHFPYGKTTPRRVLQRAIDRIADAPDISEVILSGGDPLVLDNQSLADCVQRIAAIDHVRRLRIHTRVPVVLPERIDAQLLECLAAVTQPVTLVIHANHPRELDSAVIAALARCRTAGLTLLNQSVLLAGVNDDADVLAELSEALFAAGVLPYYLHLLDKVRGAAHFAVADPHARKLQASLRARLPGYLVPRFVRETPGAASKLPLV